MIVFAIVFVTLLAVFGVWLAAGYNSLVALRNIVKNAWAQIDVQLERRHDLIPNLIETVKGYAAHERETLDAVIRARSAAISAKGVAEQSQAEEQLSGVLGRLMLVVEQYPELKANQNFLALQEELTSTENRIGFARQAYNDAVMGFNTQAQSFPLNLIAGAFHFGEQPFFEIDGPEREAPQVSFA
ncbi:MAG: LemA family protein [Acidobacteria bacterium]|nr:LemA family protein [Acidobacteriota bacterium]